MKYIVFNKDGRFYVEDGTTYRYIYKDGTECHYEFLAGNYMRLHREDGPALVYDNGKIWEYYFHGEQINCSSTEELKRIIKLKAFF